MKLSEPQKEVIKRLQKGELLHYMSGINAKCFFSRKNVSWATIGKLEDIGLIDRKEKYIVLTELGKTIEL